MSLSTGERAKQMLNTAATKGLHRIGVSSPRALEIKREGWWWLGVRGQALSKRSGLVEASAIVWTTRLRAELVRVEVPVAGPGEVTIEVLHSLVSPGTERAQYLGLPNARVSWNHRPGFAIAGRVLTAGPDVAWATRGQMVAASGAPHQSIVTISAERVAPLPAGLDPAAATALHFGLISGQGVRLASLDEDQPFVLLGAGVIGLLAQRIASARGAGPCTVVAATRRREKLARQGGVARFLSLEEDPDAVEALRSKVVIEASGAAPALPLAARIAEREGRIVLLGSTRGQPQPLPLDELLDRRLSLVGAHVSTLEKEERLAGEALRASMAASFLDDLAQGRLTVDDLVDRVADPREADDVYRQLANDPNLVGVRFDWTRLDRGERVGAGRLLRLPDLRGHGVEASDPLRPARSRVRRGAETRPTIADPGTQRLVGSNSPLRLALIGCGEIATINADAAASAVDVELVGYFDLDRKLAEDLAAMHGGTVSSSTEELLARSDVDAVFISVPHHLHAPLAVQALEAGKHVVVEKPPASDLAGAMRIRDAAQRMGRTVSVCFPNRYDDGAAATKALIDRGVLGELHGAQITVLDDQTASYLHGGFSGRSSSTWRASRERAGGGVLIMNLVHSIDLLCHLAPSAVEEVHAVTATRDWPAEVEDTATVILRFTNGAIATVMGCVTVRGMGQHHEEFRLWGSRGQIQLLPDPLVYTSVALGEIRPVRWHQVGSGLAVPIRQAYLERFARAIALGETPDVAFDESIAVQSVIEAAYRSAATSRPVRVDALQREMAT